jgi:hypothetical protein
LHHGTLAFLGITGTANQQAGSSCLHAANTPQVLLKVSTGAVVMRCAAGGGGSWA